MNILADENIDINIVFFLRKNGYNVISITEDFSGISDDNVLDIANRNEAILLTADKDFGEMVFRQNFSFYGVVLIRLSGMLADEKENLILNVFNNHAEELKNAFTVISAELIRIRSWKHV